MKKRKAFPNMTASDSQTSANEKSNIKEKNKSTKKARNAENADVTENGDSKKEDESDDEPELGVFIVKKILEAKMVNVDGKDVRYYKVRWGDSWEPESNLLDCMEIIDEFWKERPKEEHDEKKENYNGTEVSSKGYSLRHKNAMNRKKRKAGNGWTSKRTLRQKKLKVQQPGPSSSDVSEASEASDKADDQDVNRDMIGFDPANLEKFSPQVVLKNVNHKRRLLQKRKRVKELFSNSSNGSDRDGDGDDEDEEDNLPLQNFRRPAVLEDDASDSTIPADAPLDYEGPNDVDKSTLTVDKSTLPGAASILSDIINSTPQTAVNSSVANSGVLLPDEFASSGENKSASMTLIGELELNSPPIDALQLGNVPQAPLMTEVSNSTTTTTTTITSSTTHAVEERSNDRLKWSRLTIGTGIKGDAILCGSGSEEEEERPSTVDEVKVKQEPVSESEGEEELFKRSAKIKAKFVIRRYCETGGDDNLNASDDGEDYIPNFVPPIIRQEEEDFDVSHVPSVDLEAGDVMSDVSPNVNNFNEVTPNSHIPINGVTSTSPNVVPPNITTVLTPTVHTLPSIHSPNAKSSQLNCTPNNLSAKSTKLELPVTSPTGTDIFTYAAENVSSGAPLPCDRPILSLSLEHIKNLVTRVLFLVRKLIEFCRLKPVQVPEHSRALIAKAVVFATRESYSSEKPEPIFLEKQVNDLTQIVLKELPFQRLMPLLYNYALSNADTTTQANPNDYIPGASLPIVSLGTLTSSISVPVASSAATLNTLTQTLNNIADAHNRDMHLRATNTFLPHSTRQIAPRGMRQIAPVFQSPPIAFPRNSLPLPNILCRPSGIDSTVVHPAGPQWRPPVLVSTVSVPAVPLFRPINIRPKTVNMADSVAVTSTQRIPSMSYMESPPPIKQINQPLEHPLDYNTSPVCNIASIRSLKFTDTQPVLKSSDIINSSDAKINNDKNTEIISSSTPSVSTVVSSTSSEQKQSLVTNKQGNSPNVKTVCGPHRFYRPPQKVTPIAKKQTEVSNKVSKNVNTGNEQVRYKDLVNQQFTSDKSADDPNKIIDLTDLTVESDDDVEVGSDVDRSDEES